MRKPEVVKGNDFPDSEPLIADEIAQIKFLDLGPLGLLKIGRNESVAKIPHQEDYFLIPIEGAC